MRDCNEKPATAAAENNVFPLPGFHCGRREDLQWKARPDEGGTRHKNLLFNPPQLCGKQLELFVGEVKMAARHDAQRFQLAILQNRSQ